MIYKIIIFLSLFTIEITESVKPCPYQRGFIPNKCFLPYSCRKSSIANFLHDCNNNSSAQSSTILNKNPNGLARTEFPIYENNSKLIYFDNASTTHKPRIVLETILDFYARDYSNVHRSVYRLSSIATKEYGKARQKVADFINARNVNEIVFTSGATDSINLVANTWGHENISQGDTILLPISEHNSNIIPWQLLCNKKGCNLEFIRLNNDGTYDLNHLEELLENNRVKVVSLAHASNVLGVIQDLKKTIRLIHDYKAHVVIDACQTLSHIPIDVYDLDCDFLVGSGHKMYGPTGIGFLYGKLDILTKLKPYKGGGGMIESITQTSFNTLGLPFKFEPGTPPIAQAVGLGAAIDFINSVTFEEIQSHELKLLKYLCERLKGVNLFGFDIEKPRIPILSFTVDNINSYDLTSILASKDISLRCGKHCAHLLHDYLKVDNTIRVSFGVYNNIYEIDELIKNLRLKDEII